MTTRSPKSAISNKLLTTSAGDTEYTVPANSVFTVSACTLNNTTGTARTVTINVIPSGDTASADNQVATALPVAASGAAPTTVPGLVGHHIEGGGKINFVADAGAAVSCLLSGYLTQ